MYRRFLFSAYVIQQSSGNGRRVPQWANQCIIRDKNSLLMSFLPQSFKCFLCGLGHKELLKESGIVMIFKSLSPRPDVHCKYATLKRNYERDRNYHHRY